MKNLVLCSFSGAITTLSVPFLNRTFVLMSLKNGIITAPSFSIVAQCALPIATMKGTHLLLSRMLPRMGDSPAADFLFWSIRKVFPVVVGLVTTSVVSAATGIALSHAFAITSVALTIHVIASKFGKSKTSALLAASHQKLKIQSLAIKQKMTSKEVWKNPEFISKVSIFMEEAYREIDLFYSELEKKSSGDLKKMEKLIRSQYRQSGGPNFCYSYFYNSLAEMYHLARSCAYIEGESYQFPNLTVEDQQPYFDVTTPQYKWRTDYYNNFCKKLDAFTTRLKNSNIELNDPRFKSWSMPDEKFKTENNGFPDTRPSGGALQNA